MSQSNKQTFLMDYLRKSHLLYLSGASYMFLVLSIISAAYVLFYLTLPVLPTPDKTYTYNTHANIVLAVFIALIAHNLVLTMKAEVFNGCPLPSINLRIPPFILWLTLHSLVFEFYIPFAAPSISGHLLFAGWAIGLCCITPLMMFHSPAKHGRSLMTVVATAALTLYIAHLLSAPELLNEPFFIAFLAYLVAAILPGILSFIVTVSFLQTTRQDARELFGKPDPADDL